ncbi:glucose-6-phosphate isomerase [Clostridium acetireducens DSM 10703]|jgi:glucose-6-phosphate isomerase|uniref:Glucose-6-phosphate isomerase n=1 Tax=Clostridium acetireducens DSM 10703 TaxID=1121290 RepID=A0A1E8EZT0_9CLOT|nr:glucose-6-phosphate isomerase [Clostridium acetireducens]OFI06231.1 glucose-6-phosphate isomerase [Clostridium acetireducens DSM 10703]
MKTPIKLDLTKAKPYLEDKEIAEIVPFINTAHNILHKKIGVGNESLGWIDIPVNYDKKEFSRIKKVAERIKSNSDVLIVIGIGGSYLGARAAIEMLKNSFYNILDRETRDNPAIFFAGNNISSKYMIDLLNLIGDKDLSINVISKSGTTTEPAIAFRIFRDVLEKKYGKEKARKRIFITTDKEKGALKELADKEQYETFVIPDDIGGRYSVLTAVGLLPIAVAGINIDNIMLGAAEARNRYSTCDLSINHAYLYAAARNILYKKEKNIEILANFEPSLHYFGEWWKQLFGESEGKNNKGIFPASVDFSTDLHSMGQYIQQGRRSIFETFINIENVKNDILIKQSNNDDGLNFISGKSMHFVNKQAFKGTVIAHNTGGVPAIILNVPKLDEFYFGYMVYFFEKACAISGYLLGINPFNQPGVEDYKKNMFALLGKSGYEHRKLEIESEFQKY